VKEVVQLRTNNSEEAEEAKEAVEAVKAKSRAREIGKAA
jgi:hypothetical protein